MVDLLFVLLLVGLFAVTAAFVVVCDRMLGSDEEAGAGLTQAPAEKPKAVAA